MVIEKQSEHRGMCLPRKWKTYEESLSEQKNYIAGVEGIGVANHCGGGGGGEGGGDLEINKKSNAFKWGWLPIN